MRKNSIKNDAQTTRFVMLPFEKLMNRFSSLTEMPIGPTIANCRKIIQFDMYHRQLLAAVHFLST